MFGMLLSLKIELTSHWAVYIGDWPVSGTEIQINHITMEARIPYSLQAVRRHSIVVGAS